MFREIAAEKTNKNIFVLNCNFSYCHLNVVFLPCRKFNFSFAALLWALFLDFFHFFQFTNSSFPRSMEGPRPWKINHMDFIIGAKLVKGLFSIGHLLPRKKCLKSICVILTKNVVKRKLCCILSRKRHFTRFRSYTLCWCYFNWSSNLIHFYIFMMIVSSINKVYRTEIW